MERYLVDLNSRASRATTLCQDLVVGLVETLPSRRSGRSSGQSLNCEKHIDSGVATTTTTSQSNKNYNQDLLIVLFAINGSTEGVVLFGVPGYKSFNAGHQFLVIMMMIYLSVVIWQPNCFILAQLSPSLDEP